MANDAINEMISAFAIGCMDNENFKQFRRYVEKGGELPEGDLGDLQNIIALIPTILDIKPPREELKNELGKQLIEIQKNILNKNLEARRETRIDVTEEFIQRDSSTKIFDVDEKRQDVSQQTQISIPQPPLHNAKKNSEQISVTPNKIKNEKGASSLSILLLWVFSGILFISILLLSFLFWNKTDNLISENTKLHNQIVKLRADFAKTNSFVTENRDFVQFFSYPNISIVELKGLEKNSKERGRLYLSFDAGKGLLQLFNMPRLEPGNVYKLWIVSRNATFALGSFEPTPDKKYIIFSEIPFTMKEDIQLFRITKEENQSIEIPQGETVLFGSFQKATPTKRKRRR